MQKETFPKQAAKQVEPLAGLSLVWLYCVQGPEVESHDSMVCETIGVNAKMG